MIAHNIIIRSMCKSVLVLWSPMRRAQAWRDVLDAARVIVARITMVAITAILAIIARIALLKLLAIIAVIAVIAIERDGMLPMRKSQPSRRGGFRFSRPMASKLIAISAVIAISYSSYNSYNSCNSYNGHNGHNSYDSAARWLPNSPPCTEVLSTLRGCKQHRNSIALPSSGFICVLLFRKVPEEPRRFLEARPEALPEDLFTIDLSEWPPFPSVTKLFESSGVLPAVEVYPRVSRKHILEATSPRFNPNWTSCNKWSASLNPNIWLPVTSDQPGVVRARAGARGCAGCRFPEGPGRSRKVPGGSFGSLEFSKTMACRVVYKNIYIYIYIYIYIC